MSRRTIRASIATLALLTGLLAMPAGPALAGSMTWQWPTGCGGAATLQDCIDVHAITGDSVEIDTNTPIAESVTISKSMSLSLAPGFHASLQGIFVGGDSLPGGIDVALHDLRVDGSISARLWSGSSNTLSIANVAVTDSVGVGGDIDLDVRTSSTIAITGNVLRALGSQTDGIQFYDGAAPGDLSVDIIGNQISGRGNTDAGAGIDISANASGSLIANVDNNAILSPATCTCDDADGITVTAVGTAAQTYNVVGNTVDRSGWAGMTIQNEVLGSAITRVNVFNNVVTRSSRWGLYLGETGAHAALVQIGHNDFFHNGDPNQLAGHSAGSGNVSVSPRYVDEKHGNVKLSASSPVVNAGVVCSPGGVAMRDAAGNGRRFGSSVDLGAYERGAAAPTGVALVGDGNGNVLVGTSGDDILCGMGGADLILGNAGKDYLDGGSGKDELFGGAGADLLFGRSGNDMLCTADGKHGNDHLDGGPGTDGYLADPGDIRTSVERTAECKQP